MMAEAAKSATSGAMRILIIEDDREAAAYLVKALKEAGHVTDHAADGETGFHMATTRDYDVLVVDRMLPERDGLSVVAGLREKGSGVPVLILSALGQVRALVRILAAAGKKTGETSLDAFEPRAEIA